MTPETSEQRDQEAKQWEELSRYLKEAKEQSIINRNQCEAYRVEYESRAIWIAKMNKILGYDNSDGFHCEPSPHKIAASLKSATDNLRHINETLAATIKAQGIEIRSLRELKSGDPRLIAECDALKESNAELREQLSANTETISKLQHNVRLVQETHSRQVRECAEKAVKVLRNSNWLSHSGDNHQEDILAIICKAFGVPVKDECEEAFESWYVKSEHYALPCSNGKDYIREGFIAAWKLTKGEK